MAQIYSLIGFSAKVMFSIYLAAPWLVEGREQPEIATTGAFTEGPTVDREGNVYFTDIINQRIMRLGTDGVLSTYRDNSNVQRAADRSAGSADCVRRLEVRAARSEADGQTAGDSNRLEDG
jgi:sugar lactone lactonase YvrE